MQELRREPSLADLLGALSGQLGNLIHKEVELARTEMTANAVAAGRNAALVGIGGILVHGAFLALVIAAIAGLARLGLDVWQAAVVVAIACAVVGAVLIQRGRSQLRPAALTPDRTIKTLRDDAEWAKGGMR